MTIFRQDGAWRKRGLQWVFNLTSGSLRLPPTEAANMRAETTQNCTVQDSDLPER
jgi:hypothetical protein